MDQKQQLTQKIIDLKTTLSSSESSIGDWKVVKCYEAKLQDKEMPYDVEKLMADRQAVRDEINKLQKELEKE